MKCGARDRDCALLCSTDGAGSAVQLELNNRGTRPIAAGREFGHKQWTASDSTWQLRPPDEWEQGGPGRGTRVERNAVDGQVSANQRHAWRASGWVGSLRLLEWSVACWSELALPTR